jgi:hypothetical protein
VDRGVALLYEPLVVLVLPGVARAYLLKDRGLVARVHPAGEPLGGVHADHKRLTALLTLVKHGASLVRVGHKYDEDEGHEKAGGYQQELAEACASDGEPKGDGCK